MSTEPLFGVTLDTLDVRLNGVRIDVGSQSPEDALIADAEARLGEESPGSLIEQHLAEAMKGFIGMPFLPPAMDAMKDTIAHHLKELQNSGDILDYTVESSIQKNGVLVAKVTLQPCSVLEMSFKVNP